RLASGARRAVPLRPAVAALDPVAGDPGGGSGGGAGVVLEGAVGVVFGAEACWASGGGGTMNHEEAVKKLDVVLAHAWSGRAFLKHADEIQENEEFLDVHRAIFDYIRATEPARLRGDYVECIHRARGKFSKLKKASAFFSENYKQITDHTNWQMAAVSLSGCV